MIDKKVAPDFGARMDIDPRATMRPFCHDPGDERQLVPVKNMSQALDRDRLDAGITDDDLVVTGARRISLVRGFDVGLQKFADRLDFPNEVKHDLLSPATW